MAEAKKKSNTAYVTYEGEIFYPRLFEASRDTSEYHEKTDGQYNCVFVPTAYYIGAATPDSRIEGTPDEVLEVMVTRDGHPTTTLGHEMIKEYAVAGGRRGVKFKRPHKHATIDDFGGAPEVFDWTNGITPKLWDSDVDGELGNGTKIQVKVSYYRDTVRLEKVAVLEHVPYEQSEMASVGW
jgi:hypothetical protein